MSKRKIKILGIEVRTQEVNNHSYVCITDIAKAGRRGEPRFAINNYLNRKNTVEYLGLWEQLNNNDFNVVEFHNIRTEIGSNNYTISFKDWIGDTNAIGVQSRAGRYGGTFVHIDIGLHFTSWFDVEFNLYFIKEFQRLKSDEFKRLGQPFDVSRLMTKGTFPLLTDGIKGSIPRKIRGTKKEGVYFASAVDMINSIVFGMTASEWKKKNPKAKPGENMRDYASAKELIILTVIQGLDERLRKWGCDKQQRYELLLDAKNDWFDILKNKKTIKDLEKRIKHQRSQ